MDKSVFIIIPVALVILAGAAWYGMHRQEVSISTSTASTTAQYGNQNTTAAQNVNGAVVGDMAPVLGQQQTSASPQGPAATTNPNPAKIMQATLHTNFGDITFAFDPELSPTAVANFEKLAANGFYNGTKFHRVIKGFMIQGGDPLTKDDSKMAQWGTGGPGYQFADEITAGSKNNIGMVSMANSGPNTNGSQFYINTANNNFLDGKYTVFAHVTAGMDVVTKIENTPTVPGDRPTSPVIVTSVDLK